MNKKTDYKKDKVIDLGELIPGYLRERIATGLTDSVFNRLMTKADFSEFNGYVGEPDFRSELNSIPERTEFREQNQLQPVINYTVASQDYHLTFQDFLRKLARTGVLTEEFDRWGKSQQFNWVPPIDIDKLINFSDYYWEVSQGPAQYITIKNQSTQVESTSDEINKAFFNRVTRTPLTDLTQASSLGDGNVVLYDEFEDNRVSIASITAGVVTPLDGTSVASNVVMSELARLTHDILSISVVDGRTNILINGDVSTGQWEGVIGSAIYSVNDRQELFEILEVTYDDASGQSTVIAAGELVGTAYDLLCLQPRVLVEYFNKLYSVLGEREYRTPLSWFNNFQYLAYKSNEVWNSATDFSTLGGSTITDNSANFLTLLSPDKAYIVEIFDGPNKGLYGLRSFTNNSLTIDFRLMTDLSAGYRILERSTLSDLTTIGTVPYLGQPFWDISNDQLRVYDGTQFVTQVDNFSALANTVQTEKETVENDWSTQNTWIHKNQLSTFAGYSRATLPIIEYDNDIELSNTSVSSYQWRYSRQSGSAYSKVDTEPTLFEIHPIIVESGNEFQYLSNTRIRLSRRFGNLSPHISPGDIIQFSDFSSNAGAYQVASVQYIGVPPAIGLGGATEGYTEIEFSVPLPSTTDFTTGGVIHPQVTSRGDLFDIDHPQWQFAGVKSIEASSETFDPHPALSEVSGTFTDVSPQNLNLQNIVGPIWQEYSILDSGSFSGVRLNLVNTGAISLANICLFEDYQEGDIRVYINGVRQYGNFEEIPDNTGTFVSAIRFDEDVSLTNRDRIRIELGEAFEKDIGKRAVRVFIGASAGYSEELFNLVGHRKLEQRKSAVTEYPLFRLFDIYGDAVSKSNAIFRFKESRDAAVNGETGLRLKTDIELNDVSFENLLFKEDMEKLLCYRSLNSEDLQSIWRKGRNNEIQIPQRLSGGAWDLPNSWYYNLAHENRESITLRGVFRHFNTIKIAQTDPDFRSFSEASNFHALPEANYGIGGTIKDHNDSLDILASFSLLNNTTIPEILRFANSVYRQQLNAATDFIFNNLYDLLQSGNPLGDAAIRFIENDKKFDSLFGDATTWDGTRGIKGFIASAANLGLVQPVTPTILNVGDKILLRHHDGHVSNAVLDRGFILDRARKFATEKLLVNSSGTPLPPPQNYSVGDIIIRVVKSSKSLQILRLAPTNTWEILDIDRLHAEALLRVEQELYDVTVANTPLKQYDFSAVLNNPSFVTFSREDFEEYAILEGIDDPLANFIYDPNNPWTWNYAQSTIDSDPQNSSTATLGIGSWQALYYAYFNTPYIVDEPWKLQGYVPKPSWWDSEYLNSDPSLNRRWDISMWNNILSGTVPAGELLPDQTISSGTAGQTQTYDYLPVNIENASTVDGIQPDNMLPPVWDISNSNNPSVRSLFRKGQDPIISPGNRFSFGQSGYFEWQWKESIYYLYSVISAAYKIDPMRLVHRFVGNTYVNVGCLQVDAVEEKVASHKSIPFHGDVSGDSLTKVYGIMQWFVHFNRYAGFDGATSAHRELWSGWDINLAYQFDNVINTESFDIRSESIDITNKDYDVRLKKTEGIDDFEFKSLELQSLRIPSPNISNRESSAAWVTKVSPISPDNKEICYYHPENYPFRAVDPTTFKTYNYEILSVGTHLPRIRQVISYNVFLTENTAITGYSSGTIYTAELVLAGGSMEVFEIDSDTVNTVGDVIEQLNAEASINAEFKIEGGNISVYMPPGANISNPIDGIFDNLLAAPSSATFASPETLPEEFAGFFDLALAAAEYFFRGASFSIINSNSLAFQQNYMIIGTFEDVSNGILRVFVSPENDIPALAPAVTITGEAIPDDSITIPWETGQEVYLNSGGTLPGNIRSGTPYYLIKVDDFTFRLAESASLAEAGQALTVVGTGNGPHKVGRLRYTFRPLAGQVDFAWSRHFADKRNPIKLKDRVVFSTIQSICDLIFGYEEYLEDIGIQVLNDKQNNIDPETGRARNWPLELEKFIAWAFKFRSIRGRTETAVIGQVVGNGVLDLSPTSNPWATGSPVSITSGSNNIPPELNAEISEYYPYYVIVGLNNKISLASTRSNAMRGIGIQFTNTGGALELKSATNVRRFPSRILNPFVKQFAINHELGLPADFTKGTDTDVITAQRLYDEQLNALTVADMLFFRRDKQSIVETVEGSSKEIYGGHVFIDGLEHLLLFQNYASDGSLIYDPFLGINTPRFFLEFVKPSDYTQRPTLSGLVLKGDQFVSSIEKAVTDIRYYYDIYNSFENELSTDQARKSLGYEGRKDYLDNIGVNATAQFIFWKGYIQSKGTKKSIDVFSNHRLLGGMSVDEFWAYKLGEFGSSKKKIYPEMKLFTDDVVKKELRLEFSASTGGTVGEGYTQIRLTDRSRWNNQPDILDAMEPDRAYYFDAKVTELIENAENLIYVPDLPPALNNYLNLSFPVEGVEIFYDAASGERVRAIEGTDYELVTATLLRFDNRVSQWTNISVAGLTYDYDSENPAKIIDKSDTPSVVADVPIWNPALGQQNPLGQYAVDIESSLDPALYNGDLSNNVGNFWSSRAVNTTWLDTSMRHYLPYYDRRVYPEVHERSLNWGKLAEFGDIRLYQWIETEIPPEEYDGIVAAQERNQDLPVKDRITGQVYRQVYINNGGEWVRDRDIVVNLFNPQISIFGSNITGTEFLTFLNDSGMSSVPIDVYLNGKYAATHQFVSPLNLVIFLFNLGLSDDTYISLVKPVHEPTDQELADGDYLIYTPHSRTVNYDPIKRQEVTKYYYWVRNLKSQKLLNGQSLTLFDAERELKEMTRPYMFMEGFRNSDAGYGVLFGITFDPDNPNLPNRYTQCIVKGLQNTVKDNGRYVLRFTKDQSLRDRLGDNLSLHNKHNEWKLFRKNQPFKVDEFLWRKMIESAIGFAVDESYQIDFDTVVPSLERATYDSFFPQFSSRIGLRDDQVIMDKEPLRQLILDYLLQPNKEFSAVSDIEDFLQGYDLDDPSDVVLMLREIYVSFSDSEVNGLFFEVLWDSIISRKEHPDFLKTSWVSIDVNADVNQLPQNEIKIPESFASDFCFLNIDEEAQPIVISQILNAGINSSNVNQEWIGLL